jgi:putative addiction module component (TIGR02574 family)
MYSLFLPAKPVIGDPMSRIEEIVAEILTWPDEDRQRVIDAIDESIQRELAASITPEQEAELARRVAELDADPSSSISKEEVFRGLRRKS